MTSSIVSYAHLQPPRMAVFGQILAGWVFVPVCRRDDPPAREGSEQAGKVGIDADATGGDDGVAVGDAKHPLVEAPVAEAAECHAVADIVVLTLAPRHDVGCLHHRMTVGSNDADAAQGAAMVVGRGHHLAERLVPHRRPVVLRLNDLLYQRQMGLFLQHPAVVERFSVYDRLLSQLRCRLL